MHPVISSALNAICLERDDQQYAASFDCAAEIVRTFVGQDLSNLLYISIPKTVPFELVAELFDLLAWQTDDNGGAMTRAAEAWLRDGTDNRKLLIALNLEVYPFIDANEMEQVLSRLAETNPRVSGRCRYLIQSRKK